jgi:hypothetical protein
VDLTKFQKTLPYASELYGIYQPLLGWRSRAQSRTVTDALGRVRANYLRALQANIRPRYEPPIRTVRIEGKDLILGVGESVRSSPLTGIGGLRSIVSARVAELAVAAGSDEAAWSRYTSAESLIDILDQSHDAIVAELALNLTARQETVPAKDVVEDSHDVLADLLARESTVAGVLQHLHETHSPNELKALLEPTHEGPGVPLLSLLDPVTPQHSDLVNATISPIGLVQLYRQYFFEFDTFLGPAVQHLWLSPGGQVELVETSTRRNLVERSVEQSVESVERSEKSSSIQDEISAAVRSDNASNTKLGVTVSSTASYGVGFVDGSTTVGGSFNVEQSSKEAREQTHRALRQQSEKLSSEIRKSYKSTFKTVTETTDTQSRRYVIQNTTTELVNYELRRKMRQVGVQVQDYGVQLCWQAYVDQPGAELGIAKLVHIAAPADLQGLHEPDAPAMPDPEVRDQPRSLRSVHFGIVTGQVIPTNTFIQLAGPFALTPPKPGYIYSRAEVAVTNSEDYANPRAYPRDTAEAVNFAPLQPPDVAMIATGDPTHPTEPSVRSIVVGWRPESPVVGDHHNYFWDLDITVIWKPSQQLIKDTGASYASSMATFRAEKERAYREAMFKAASDRITLASKIDPRPFDELREEERIVVYRHLIGKLLEVAGVTTEDPKLHHVFAELVQSMFDVDKMLYFVAPEWWMPRYSDSHQNLGLHPSSTLERVTKLYDQFDQSDTTSWGGASGRQDNYWITDKSAPARLGSSLGWLLQLDGDDLRNAYLNAPWVKAVIPIRAGHEWKALSWLSSDAIEGSDGLTDKYQATEAGEKARILDKLKAYSWDDAALVTTYAAMTDPDDIRIIDAIRYLIIHVQERHALSLRPVPNPDDATMNYLPTDEIFEHGFDPLSGGFQAEGTKPFKPFDQWIEVLPTDQIVPVEVAYDPMTGRLL